MGEQKPIQLNYNTSNSVYKNEEKIDISDIENESSVEEKIRNVGWEPEPNTDAIPKELYQEQLIQWLNEQAGIAFPVEQRIKDDCVKVKFELPFGGSFTQEFVRDDVKGSKQHTYIDFIETAGLTIDNLEDLTDGRDVPIRRNAEGSWEVCKEQRNNKLFKGYQKRALELAYTRLVLLPISLISLYYSYIVDSTIVSILLIGIWSVILIQFIFIYVYHTINKSSIVYGEYVTWVKK